MTVLLLRLSAPMQAWGSRSRFSERDTEREPTKSGVIGLLCAALGKPREEEEGDGWPTLAQLAALRFGVRVDKEGIVRRDFQTAGGGTWLGQPYGVSKASGASPETVISSRYYLSEGVFLAGIESPDRPLLERLDTALANPVWPLFLGRKAFPPAEPVRLSGGSLRELDLEATLEQEPWLPGGWDPPPEKKPEKLRVLLECRPGEEGEARQDIPVSFVSEDRRHGVRRVREFYLKLA